MRKLSRATSKMTKQQEVTAMTSPPRMSMIVQSDVIVVRVGAEQRNYTLHRMLLAHRSGFFLGALSGNFKETDDGIIPLDDVDVDSFEVFIDWVYEKELPACVYEPWKEGDRIPSLKFIAYVLAERLLVPGMKHALMNMIFHQYQTRNIHPMFSLIIYLFANLPESDPMLQFMVDAYCINYGIRKLRPESTVLAKQLPQDFLARVLIKLGELSDIRENEKIMKREDYNETEGRRYTEILRTDNAFPSNAVEDE